MVEVQQDDLTGPGEDKEDVEEVKSSCLPHGFGVADCPSKSDDMKCSASDSDGHEDEISEEIGHS